MTHPRSTVAKYEDYLRIQKLVRRCSLIYDCDPLFIKACKGIQTLLVDALKSMEKCIPITKLYSEKNFKNSKNDIGFKIDLPIIFGKTFQKIDKIWKFVEK